MDDTKIFGPWAICEEPPNSTWRKGRSIYSVTLGTRVADVSPLAADCKAKAYAHLIAEAPNLLAALRIALNALKESTEYRQGNPAFEQAVAAAHDAIAKATGANP